MKQTIFALLAFVLFSTTSSYAQEDVIGNLNDDFAALDTIPTVQKYKSVHMLEIGRAHV